MSEARGYGIVAALEKNPVICTVAIWPKVIQATERPNIVSIKDWQ